MQKQYRRNVFSNSGAIAVGSILQLAALAIISQLLNTAEYANYLVATAIVGVAEIGSDFGTRIWAAKKFAVSQTPARVLTRALLGKLCYSICTVILLAIFLIQDFGLVETLLCAAIAMTQPSTDPFLWYLRGIERLDIEAAMVLMVRVVVAVTITTVALMGHGLVVILLGWLLCNLARIVIESRLAALQPLFHQHEEGSRSSLAQLKEVLLATLPLGGSLLSMSLFHRFGILLLNMVGTPADVALFGTGYKFVSAASFVATSIGVSLFPRLVRAVENQDAAGTNGVIKSEIMTVTAFFGPACVVGILVLPTLCQWLYSGDLSSTGWIMVVLMPGLYMSSINIGTKFTLNVMSLNWYDTASVLIGLATFSAVFFLAVGMPISYRTAVAWGAGEAMMFTVKVVVLRLMRRDIDLHVPVVATTFAVLVLTAAMR